MSKILKLFSVFFVSLLISNNCLAELKFGVLDADMVYEKSIYGKNIRQRLDGEFKPRKKKLESQEKEIKIKLENLQKDRDILTEKEKVSKERELAALQQNYQRTGEEMQMDFNSKHQEEIALFNKQINSAVAKVAENNKFDAILPSRAIHFSKQSLDCSNLVITELDKQYKTDSKKS